MIPAPRAITVYRGDAFSQLLWVTEPVPEGDPAGPPVVLTGYTPRAQIRADRALTSPVLATFTCALLDQVTDPGGIQANLTPAQTAALTPLIECGGVWDLEIFTVDGTDNTTLVTGPVRVLGDVTRTEGL